MREKTGIVDRGFPGGLKAVFNFVELRSVKGKRISTMLSLGALGSGCNLWPNIFNADRQ